MEDDNELYQNMFKQIAARKAYANKLQGELEAPVGQGLNDEQLRLLSGVESSFGKDLKHKTIASGMHAGSAAIGQYGMMPLSIKDVAGKLKNKESKLGAFLPEEISMPDVEELHDLSDDQIKQRLEQNPELENKVARLMYQDAILKRGDNPMLNQYAWKYGSNLTPEQITAAKMNADPRTAKFRKLYEEMMKAKKSIPQSNILVPRTNKFILP